MNVLSKLTALCLVLLTTLWICFDMAPSTTCFVAKKPGLTSKMRIQIWFGNTVLRNGTHKKRRSRQTSRSLLILSTVEDSECRFLLSCSSPCTWTTDCIYCFSVWLLIAIIIAFRFHFDIERCKEFIFLFRNSHIVGVSAHNASLHFSLSIFGIGFQVSRLWFLIDSHCGHRVIKLPAQCLP